MGSYSNSDSDYEYERKKKKKSRRTSRYVWFRIQSIMRFLLNWNHPLDQLWIGIGSGWAESSLTEDTKSIEGILQGFPLSDHHPSADLDDMMFL